MNSTNCQYFVVFEEIEDVEKFEVKYRKGRASRESWEGGKDDTFLVAASVVIFARRRGRGSSPKC